MKRTHILLLALSLTFTNCGSDDKNDNEINLKSSNVTLKNNGTYQIEASSDSKITYTSEKKFHATVSESGLIVAGKVGETNILLSNGDDTKTIKVKVTPTSNLYPEPNMEWGISKSDLVKKLGTPFAETENVISYIDYSTNAPIVMYQFDTSKKLTSAAIMVKSSKSSELAIFLDERYLAFTKVDDSYFFLNNLTANTATLAVGAQLYDTTYWMVTYIPNPNLPKSTKSIVLDNINMDAINELMNNIEKKK